MFVQAVDSRGRIAKPDPRQVAFPVTDEIETAAAEGGGAFFADADVEGTHVLQLVVPVGDDHVLQLVRPLEEVDRLLDRIGLILVLGRSAASPRPPRSARSSPGPRCVR